MSDDKRHRMIWVERRKRLPEEGARVMVCHTPMHVIDIATKEGPRWMVYPGGFAIDNKDVSHWMPLPDDPGPCVAMSAHEYLGKKKPK